MAKEPTPVEAPAASAGPSYVVAFGVIVTLDPKTKKTVEIGVGKPFTPADEAEAESLLKAGRILTAEDYAAKVGGSSVTGAIDAANASAAAEKARADKLQAELDALKTANPPAPAPAPAPK